jgi:hypothetical protein
MKKTTVDIIQATSQLFRESTRLLLSLIILSFALIISGCSFWRPFHPTPLDALTEFPGYLSQANLSLAEVLQQEKIAGGLVLLYRYPLNLKEKNYSCATTFVTQEKNGGWRAQSASRIGCHATPASEFMAMYTVGGNITPLTTAYGLSHLGHQVRIEWSDGLVETVPLEDGTFLKSRPAILMIHKMELLNADGEVVETR